MRHVVTMTSTGSIGLVAIFLVDFANLFYISQLGINELAAAIGYAGTILFFSTAIGIGLSIAASANVSRLLGAGKTESARSMAGSALLSTVVIALVIAAIIYPYLPAIVALLGARGTTAQYSVDFLRIVIPSMPLLCLGMSLSALLRAVGDAKQAMTLTLLAGITTALLDPIFIFVFDLGLTGAAIVSIISRCIMVSLGLYLVIYKHGLLAWPQKRNVSSDIQALMRIALPAVLTNVATPVGNAWVTSEIASFGNEAVAGWAIVGRVTPVAFAALFALSGAIGPILGQNLGARLFKRLNMVLSDAIKFIMAYSLVAWTGLFLLQDVLANAFNAHGQAYDLLSFFCSFAAAGFIFNAALFVSNAAFNNLGYPLYSTAFNWARATLGTIPFTIIGARLYGAEGVLAGQAIGGIIFGLLALFVCRKTISWIEAKDSSGDLPPPPKQGYWRMALSAFTSGKGASAG